MAVVYGVRVIRMVEVRKECIKCNKPYIARSNIAKYCPECRVQAYKDAVISARLRARKHKMLAQQKVKEIKMSEHSLQRTARSVMEKNLLHAYSDEKFYVEVTMPILRQLGDVEQICRILDAYKNEDRIRILKELLAKITHE